MIYFQVGGRPLGGKVEPESQRGDERKLFVGMLRKNHIFKKLNLTILSIVFCALLDAQKTFFHIVINHNIFPLHAT